MLAGDVIRAGSNDHGRRTGARFEELASTAGAVLDSADRFSSSTAVMDSNVNWTYAD